MRVGLAASLRARPGATCMRRRAHDTPIDRIPSFRPDSRDQVVIVTEVGAKPSRQGLTAEAMGGVGVLVPGVDVFEGEGGSHVPGRARDPPSADWGYYTE